MLRRLLHYPVLPAAIFLLATANFVFRGLSWVGLVALVGSLFWLAFDVIRFLMSGRRVIRIAHHPPKPADREPSIVSMVFFLSDSRDPSEDTIRKCISDAMDVEFDPENPDAESFVVEFRPPVSEENPFSATRHFMIRLPQGLFSIVSSSAPYVSNPEEFARQSIRDKRLRQAVEHHAAWVSVDYMEEERDPDSLRAAYLTIGKVLASVAGPDCLAIFCPELQRCNEFDPSLIEILQSGNPLRIFEEPTFEPVIEISEDDPRMRAAVAKAVNRWPEFVSAFSSRNEENEERFIVKAEFREGRKCEFMWVTVFEIHEELIDGVLINDPHELENIYRGSRVSISLDRLNDWIYPDENGELIGGFTLEVLADEE